MKKIFSILPLLSVYFLVSAQKQSDFAKVTDRYYMSKYEVTNSEYRIFLNHLLQTKQDALYKRCAPDTMLWEKGNNVPYATYYFRYPSYDKYPLVGVSYEGAV